MGAFTMVLFKLLSDQTMSFKEKSESFALFIVHVTHSR